MVRWCTPLVTSAEVAKVPLSVAMAAERCTLAGDPVLIRTSERGKAVSIDTIAERSSYQAAVNTRTTEHLRLVGIS